MVPDEAGRLIGEVENSVLADIYMTSRRTIKFSRTCEAQKYAINFQGPGGIILYRSNYRVIYRKMRRVSTCGI